MFTKVILGLAAMALACLPVLAQSPAPIVVQAIMPATAAPTAPAPNAASATTTSEAALGTLLVIKAANEEILRKQAATLLQLEEMEKAADQIKIYSKRG